MAEPTMSEIYRQYDDALRIIDGQKTEIDTLKAEVERLTECESAASVINAGLHDENKRLTKSRDWWKEAWIRLDRDRQALRAEAKPERRDQGVKLGA
jgi:FtsZ-binding cell division protein ZapB